MAKPDTSAVRQICVGTVLTLSIEDGLVCGVAGDSRNWFALLGVLPFVEGAPSLSLFLLLRTDRVNRYPQAPAIGVPCCTLAYRSSFPQRSYTLEYTRLITSV